MKKIFPFLFLVCIFFLAGCEKDDDQDNKLISRRWMFKGFTPRPAMYGDTNVYYHPVPGELSYMGLTFGKNNQVGITSSCNFGGGDYYILGNAKIENKPVEFVIRHLFLTLVFCGDYQHPTIKSIWEDRYLTSLLHATYYIVNKDTLKIYSTGEVAFDTLVVFPGGEMIFTEKID